MYIFILLLFIAYSYEISSPKLFLNYSTSWDLANTSFSIKNTGLSILKFDIPSLLSDYTFVPKSGVIEPSNTQIIQVSYNTEKYYLEEDDSIVIHFYSDVVNEKDNDLDYNNFYEFPVVKRNIDCKEKDIKTIIHNCENGIFEVEWQTTSDECYSDLLYRNESFTCKKLEKNSAISIWSLFFVAITLLMLIISLTITFIKCTILVVTVRTHPVFLFLLSLGHLLVAIADYLSCTLELDKTTCNVVIYLYVYGLHTIVSSLNIILDHLKYQETQMVMSPWEKKRFYYAHCIETYIVLTIYVICCHNPWVKMIYNIDDIVTISRYQCIPRLIDRGLLFAPSVYISSL